VYCHKPISNSYGLYTLAIFFTASRPRKDRVPEKTVPKKMAKRIESVAGPKIQCTWIPKKIEDWLEESDR
jgi:hypothetical protein